MWQLVSSRPCYHMLSMSAFMQAIQLFNDFVLLGFHSKLSSSSLSLKVSRRWLVGMRTWPSFPNGRGVGIRNQSRKVLLLLPSDVCFSPTLNPPEGYIRHPRQIQHPNPWQIRLPSLSDLSPTQPHTSKDGKDLVSHSDTCSEVYGRDMSLDLSWFGWPCKGAVLPLEVGGALYCRVFDRGHPERWQQQLAGRFVAVLAVIAVVGLGSWESFTRLLDP